MSELKVEIEGGAAKMVEPLGKETFLVDGEEKKLDIQVLDKKKFHIIKDHQSFSADVLQANYQEKSFQIKVNTRRYNLQVEDRFDLLLQKLGMEDLAAAGVSDLKAPMPGLVLSFEVEVGQEIKQDEPLIVLEAMKMENVLKAPADVVIKSIAVEKGQAVEKNQLLIEFES